MGIPLVSSAVGSSSDEAVTPHCSRELGVFAAGWVPQSPVSSPFIEVSGDLV